ncbi:MAG: tRNA (guanosine(46)-N7)-methyltransferase TrmB [Candidatus Brocadiaceae bacterium]|nr:tRNA (guanosine(46)-N7)-methyltransferase TrmB [Candidatus Brocadiaceae bacterium]
MGRKKLHRLSELENFDNLIQFTDQPKQDDFRFYGTWAKDYFKNNNPITLELACGKGAYTLAFAEKYPDRNFIGVDIKGPRLWSGCVAAQQRELNNVAFLRAEILDLAHYFTKGEVDEIWITFPDPFIENSRINRRLTSTKYLATYKNIVRDGASIHLKTDSTPLFDFSLRSLEKNRYVIEEKTYDVYDDEKRHEDIYIKTDYERRHLADNRVIKYARFSLAK